ncbi:CRT10-domain-containing protein [Scheffersomyces xylosifermentans]|uniref:CRT10-domain-containing protein n=1 Tax=Scheffersomyces xylosifermentans TaxID=1304137 RepID=UPI00315D524F
MDEDDYDNSDDDDIRESDLAFEFVLAEYPPVHSSRKTHSEMQNIFSDGRKTTKESLPLNSDIAFIKWEQHDRRTLEDVNRYSNHDHSLFQDEFNSDFTTIETTDPSRILKRSLAEMYHDGLSLNHLGIKKLHNLENIRRYKNNLSAVISDSQNNEFLVQGSNSELVVYDFDNMTHMPNKKAVLRFDTRPAFTSTTDRLISTWPYFPHTINFLKSYQGFDGRQVLGACLDDGTLMIWYSETITDFVKKLGIAKKLSSQDEIDEIYNDNNRFYGLKVEPDFRLKMESSLWGLDFLNYNDSFGISHNLIVVSDNSQSVVLFYYHPVDHQFYHVKSHQILHNIPEVSFSSYKVKSDGTHTLKISCASISRELIIFKFNFRIRAGPLNKREFEYYKKGHIYFVDPTMEQMQNRTNPTIDTVDQDLKGTFLSRVSFSSPRVVTRTLLGEDCWTTKPISSKYFKQVSSIALAIGDPFLREWEVVERISKESALLDLEFDPVKTSHLGGGASWSFFPSKVVDLSSNANPYPSAKFDSVTGRDDEYRRIHKGLIKQYERSRGRKRQESLNGKTYALHEDLDQEPIDFLVVSTSKRLALLRADTLFCNSATKKLFDLSIPFNEEVKFSNRVSITHVIPELSCLIAVSQQGLATVMRLCQSRGVYGMRQEHIFPNALGLALGYNGYRTISGLAVMDKSILPNIPRFFVYLSYTDGIVVAYELKQGGDEDIEVSLMCI